MREVLWYPLPPQNIGAVNFGTIEENTVIETITAKEIRLKVTLLQEIEFFATVEGKFP